MKTKILFFFGTRPEAIKLAPVILRMRKSDLLEPIVCVSGQHYELLAQALDAFGITSDCNLGVMRANQTLSGLTGRMLIQAENVMKTIQPSIMVVQGDATSALVGALAAFYEHIPIAHIEAGLRTYNPRAPFPEEMNRQLIDYLSSWLFAPTETAAGNLTGESINDGHIYITGNTGVDALRMGMSLLRTKKDAEGHILVTVHRRESFGKPLEHICKAVKQISREIEVIWPVHPNPHVYQVVHKELDGAKNIELLSAQPYLDFLRLMWNAKLILTDSGGVQEDAAEMHVPAILLREVTERPENLDKSAFLASLTAEGIVNKTFQLLHNRLLYNDAKSHGNPFGDGRASERIVRILENWAERRKDGDNTLRAR